MTKKEFSAAIKRERILKKLTKTELARRVGCNEAVIRYAEQGRCPSVMLADAILAGLGVRLTIGQIDSPRLKMGKAA